MGLAGRPYLSALPLGWTYVDVKDPVRVGGLSLGDREDIVHFNISFVSYAIMTEYQAAHPGVRVKFPVSPACKALRSRILSLASARWTTQ